MSPYNRSSKSTTDLVGLAIIAGLILSGVLLLSVISRAEILERALEKFGIKTEIGLVIQPVDEGTMLNSLLLLDKGEGRYSEILGLADAGSDTFIVSRTLSDLGLDLAVIYNNQQLFANGQPSEEDFVDFPLAGKRIGRLGIK